MIARIARNVFCWLVLIILSAPLFIVAGVSLNEKKLMFFPPRGLSMRWYEEIFTKSAWFDALLASLAIAAGAGLIALSIALPTAYFLWRYRVFYAKLLFGLGLLPFALPPVITALGMLMLWVPVGLAASVYGLTLAHGVFLVTMPLVMISLGLESIDREIVEAARTMGADPARTFTTVILPMIVPYMIAGYAFVFVLSMNEFIISYFLGQFSLLTLPVKVFTQLSLRLHADHRLGVGAVHPARDGGVRPGREVRGPSQAPRGLEAQGALKPEPHVPVNSSHPVQVVERTSRAGERRIGWPCRPEELIGQGTAFMEGKGWQNFIPAVIVEGGPQTLFPQVELGRLAYDAAVASISL